MAKLQKEDRIATTQADKVDMLWEYYTSLLGTAETHSHSLNLPTFYHAVEYLHGLYAPISEEEIWNVIKGLPLDKSPSLDGYTGRFYKECWPIIKMDIMAAIGALHAGDSRMLNQLNEAYMVLIPKKGEPLSVTDYQPISLVHNSAKPARLAPKLHSIVATNQSAFIREGASMITSHWFSTWINTYTTERN